MRAKSSVPNRHPAPSSNWRNRVWQIKPLRLGLLVLLLVLLLPAPVLARGSGDPMRDAAVHAAGQTLQVGPSVLQGGAATARLKDQGHYESLMQAVQAARYAVETVPAAPGTLAGAECYAANPAHALRCWFRADGLELQPSAEQPASWKLNLRLRGSGRETFAPRANP